MPSGTALSVCSLEFLSKRAFSFNGHVGRDLNGCGGVHGDMGFGTRNAEGEMILEFGDAVGMVVCNTFFWRQYKYD